MSNKIFNVNFSGIVNTAIAPGLLDATLTKYTAGSYNDDDLSAGPTLTSASYTAKGIVENYDISQIDGTVVKVGDKKALIMKISSDAVPEPQDKLTIEGGTYDVVRIEDRDPAGATFTLQVR